MSDFQVHGGDVYRRRGILDFSANINPLGMPGSVREAAIQGVCGSEYYPDPEAEELKAACAQALGVSEDMLVMGNGAAELIRAVPEVLCARGCRVTEGMQAESTFSHETVSGQEKCGGKLKKCGGLVLPCFGEYAAGMRLSGMDIREIAFEDAKTGKIPDGIDLVFLGNPSNPDGRWFTRRELTKLAAENPQTRLVIDESFLPFAREAGEVTCVPCLREWRNLAVIRSFTKIYAMPGLRLGILLTADEAFGRQVREWLQPWTVSLPAQKAGTAALSENGFVRRTVAFLEEERPQMAREIGDLPFVDRVFPSPANFLLFHVRESRPHRLYQVLLEKNIQVRDCSSFAGMSRLDAHAGETGWYRTAIRTREENEKFLETMREAAKPG